MPTVDSLLLILVDRNQNWRRRLLPSEDLLGSSPDPMGKREDNEAEIQGMKMEPLASHTGSWPMYFCESYPVSFYLEDMKDISPAGKGTATKYRGKHLL